MRLPAGELDTDQQMKVLARIWGRDREGYVFLPWIAGSARDAAARRGSFNEGRAYEWPKDEAAIKGHLQAHERDDLYFTPSLFVDDLRREERAEAERALWADLDEVDPRKVDRDLRPTIAWESSPGRYQGVWLLSNPLVGASWEGKENQRLTYHLGADRSGWDTTQLLRIPGRPNHKPGYREANGGEAVPGKLLWSDGPMYVPSDFEDLPAVPNSELIGDDLLDEELLSSIDRHEVWARIRLKCSARVRELMRVRDLSLADDSDRSEALWQIERDLADAGCNLVEIVAIVRSTVWNKYAGRADELKRLKVEAAKALATARDSLPSLEDEVAAKPHPQRLSELARQPHPRPRWMVRNMWTVGGCGFISGAPKSYKSWTAMDLAVSVASGAPFLGDFPVSESGPVLYLQEEDSEAVVLQRFEQIIDGRVPHLHWHGRVSVEDRNRALGSDPRGKGFSIQWGPPGGDIPLDVYVRRGLRLSDEGWQAWLDERLSDERYRLVVVDTLGTTAGDIDTDRASELMNRMLSPLKLLADKHGCAIAVVHHNKKDAGNVRAGQNMLGSVALHAWVEDALYFKSKEPWGDGVEVSVERESKNAMDLAFRLRVPRMGGSADGGDWSWRPEVVPFTASEETSNDSNGRVRSRGPVSRDERSGRTTAPAGSKIATLLDRVGGPRGKTIEDLADINGSSVATIRKQLTSAIQNGLVEELGEGRYVRRQTP